MVKTPLVVVMSLLAVSLARGAETTGWSTGVELRQQLAAPLSVTWENAPLEHVLATLAKSQHLAIVRDRRIDPQQSVTLTIDGQPLWEALARLAEYVHAGYTQLGPVAYLGPSDTALRLRTLAELRREEVRRLPTAVSRKLLSMRNWHWDRLARPRALALGLAEEAGVELVGADSIEHDLWPEFDLPPLGWTDRLTLLAAQFDLTFRVDDAGRRVELIGMPTSVLLTRDYLGGDDARRVAADWSRALPQAKIDVAGEQIRVAARLEDHEQLADGLHGKPKRRTKVAAGKPVYQLAVENAALDKVVEQLGKQLNLDFEWDQAAIEQEGIAVDQLISAKVTGATLGELLAAVFADTGLSFERTERGVVIRPK